MSAHEDPSRSSIRLLCNPRRIGASRNTVHTSSVPVDGRHEFLRPSGREILDYRTNAGTAILLKLINRIRDKLSEW